MNEVPNKEELLYISEFDRTKLISRHHNDLLARNFGIDKIREFVVRKYYQPTIQAIVKTYVKDYDVFLASKVVKHKLCENLRLLVISICQQKNLFIDFVTRLLILTN